MREERRTGSRVEAIDCAKGLGILLVVFGHVWRGLHSAHLWIDPRLYSRVDGWVYSFHMPLFFFISGLFIARSASKPAGRFLSDKLATIAWPYVVWSIAQALAQFAAGGATNNSGITLRELPRAIAIDPYAQFWFLYVLILCELVYLILHKLRVPAVATLLGSIVLYACSRTVGLGRWGVAYQFASSFPCFALGAVGAGFVLRRMLNWRWIALVGISLASAVALTLIVRSRPHIREAVWSGPGVACIGIAMTITLAMVLARLRTPALALLGRCTLEIYVAHIIAASGARIVLQKFFHVHSLTPHIIAGMLAGTVGPLVLAWMVWKFNIPGVFVGPWKSRRPLSAPQRDPAHVAEPALA